MTLGRYLLLLFSGPMIGCSSLTPYSQVVESEATGEFIRIDDQRIHVERGGQASGAAPIMLLHGFGASSYAFRDVIPTLAKDREVVAIDLNGFGYTERPADPDGYRFDRQCETILAVADQLGHERLHLLGHSYGGALAMFIAAEYPEKVDRLVLISPMSEFASPPWYLRNPAGRAVGYGLVRHLISRPSFFKKTFGGAYHQSEVFTDEVSEAYRARLMVEGLGDAYRGFGQQMQSSEVVEFPFSQIASPTLVLAGRHDTVVPLDQSRHVAESIADGKLLILENSGHSSPEEEPEQVAQAVTDFLD